MRFDIAGEVLGFLDRAFEMPGAEAVAPVRYHVVGEERWRTAPAWPPPGTARLALCISTRPVPLSPAPPAAGADDHELDLAASSGERTRWRGQLQPAPPTSYAAAGARPVPYTSAPFPDGLEIAGEPACLLMLEAGADRANLFCYLDEIAPDGSATYITEGCALAAGPWPCDGPGRAPADRLPDRPGKRASPVARRRRRRRVRASSGRRIPDPPAPRRAGAEPPRAARGAPAPDPLKVVGAMPMFRLRRPGRGAPIFTVLLGGIMRRLGQAIGILGVAIAAAACGARASGTIPSAPAAPLQSAAADHMRLDMMRLRLDDLGPNWRREAPVAPSPTTSSKCDPRPSDVKITAGSWKSRGVSYGYGTTAQIHSDAIVFATPADAQKTVAAYMAPSVIRCLTRELREGVPRLQGA